jgi:MscS family membrane protein
MWIIDWSIGLFLIAFAGLGLRRVLGLVEKRVFAGVNGWRKQIQEIIYKPAVVMLWAIGVGYLAHPVDRLFHLIVPLRSGVVVVSLAWLLLRWKRAIQLDVVERQRVRKKNVDADAVKILGRVLTIAIVVITTLVVLQIFGVDVLPLVAFGGVGAAAIGFAAKDVIANFFGGLMLYLTRPFVVGDQIELPDKNIEGYVEEIGWYFTSIRDKEKRPVYLPNAFFSTLLVVNLSRMTHRKLEERIRLHVDHMGKIDEIAMQIKEVIIAHPAIDRHQTLLVCVESLKELTFELYIEAYSVETKLEQFRPVQHTILKKIHEILASSGVVRLSAPLEIITHT